MQLDSVGLPSNYSREQPVRCLFEEEEDSTPAQSFKHCAPFSHQAMGSLPLPDCRAGQCSALWVLCIV